MSFDEVSYIIGYQNGARNVALSGDIIATDDGDGNVTITIEEDGGNGN